MHYVFACTEKSSKPLLLVCVITANGLDMKRSPFGKIKALAVLLTEQVTEQTEATCVGYVLYLLL